MKQTVAEKKQAAQQWLTEWPVGKEGIYNVGAGRRVRVTVVAHEKGQTGWPVLRLRCTGGYPEGYYCFYGWRHDLRAEAEVQ